MDSVGQKFGKGTGETACLCSVMSVVSGGKNSGAEDPLQEGTVTHAPGSWAAEQGTLTARGLSSCLRLPTVQLVGSKRGHSKNEDSKRARWKLSGLF